MNPSLPDILHADFEEELEGADTERGVYLGYPREGLAYEGDWATRTVDDAFDPVDPLGV